MHSSPELSTVLILSLSLIVGAITRAISQRTKFPFTVAMLLLGIAMGVGIQVAQLEGHLFELLGDGKAISPDLIVFVFLPALVFESAFALDVHAFAKDLGFILTLAVPALLAATGLTAVWMVFATSVAGVDWSWGWPAALVFGALISATDPVAVVALLREVGAPKRLALLVEGESLLNDGAAIVVYTVLVGLLISGLHTFDLGSTAWSLTRVAGGGVLVGLLLGWVTAAWLGRTFDDAPVEITLTIVLAYAAMVIAEAMLHVSGVLAIVTAGAYLAGPGRTRISPTVAHFLHRFWEMLAYVANTVIFLLVGFVIAAKLHLAGPTTLMLIAAAFVGIVLVRFALVFAFRPIANRLLSIPVDERTATVLAWGGLRGAVSLALALMVAQRTDIDESVRAQILTVTAGVVMLTILVSGTTTGWLLRKLGLTAVGPAEALASARAEDLALETVLERVTEVQADPARSAMPWQTVRANLSRRRDRSRQTLRHAVDAYESAGPDERRAALWHRALRLEREHYRHAFEHRVLGATALERLDHEIDLHLDRVEVGELEPPTSRLREEPWLAWIDGSLRRLGFGFGRRAFRRQAIRYDASRAVASAADRVLSMIQDVRDDEPEEAVRIMETYQSYRREAKLEREELRVHLPEVAAAIEERMTTRLALELEQSVCSEMLKAGSMPEAAAAKTLGAVKTQMKRLHYSVPHVRLPETAELCRGSALFAGLDEEEISDLAAMTVEQAMPAGEWLFHQGASGDSMYIIARGMVDVLDESSGEEVAIAALGSGELLGEMALLSGEPRGAGARAATPVTVGRISRKDFRKLMDTRPAVQRKVWAAYAERVFDNRLRALGMKVDERRRFVAAGSLRHLAAGESLVAEGGLFVVEGCVNDVDGPHPAGDLCRPGRYSTDHTAHVYVLAAPDLEAKERESGVNGV